MAEERSILSAVAHKIKDSQVITDMLPGGVWDVEQPGSEQAMPTMTLLWQENPETRGSRGMRIGMLIIDIWDYKGSTLAIEKVRDELEFLFDRETIIVGTRQWARFYMGSEAQVPTEITEDLVHWTIDFDVRYWRQALIKRWIAEGTSG